MSSHKRMKWTNVTSETDVSTSLQRPVCSTTSQIKLLNFNRMLNMRSLFTFIIWYYYSYEFNKNRGWDISYCFSLQSLKLEEQASVELLRMWSVCSQDFCACGRGRLPRWFFCVHVLRLLEHQRGAPFIPLSIFCLSFSAANTRPSKTDFDIHYHYNTRTFKLWLWFSIIISF